MNKKIRGLAIIVLIASAFLIISTIKVEAKAEKEWSKELNIYDSTDTQIIKQKDGFVVMQVEGSNADIASSITKYDFNGNIVWQKDKITGTRIQALDDGLLIWHSYPSNVTKYDFNGNIVWQKDYLKDSSNSNVTTAYTENIIELSDGILFPYSKQRVYAQSNYNNSGVDIGYVNQKIIAKIDKKGNFVSYLNGNDLLTNVLNTNISACTHPFYHEARIIAINKTKDDNIICLVVYKYSDTQNNGYASEDKYDYALSVVKFDKDFKYIDSSKTKISYDYYVKYSGYSKNGSTNYESINKIIEVNNGYIASGSSTIFINKDGKVEKNINTLASDLDYIDNEVYLYTLDSTNETMIYNSSIHKYTENMTDSKKNNLDIFYTVGNINGFENVQRRAIFYKENDKVIAIALNTPVKLYRTCQATFQTQFYDENMKYSVTKYHITNDDSNNDGIINNIIKNPETNSVIIIIAMILIVVIVSIISYFIYNKKEKKIKE